MFAGFTNSLNFKMQYFRQGYRFYTESGHFKHTSTNDTKNHASYCFELVRKYDHENYLSNLLLPGLSQRGSFAIRAFNVELAQLIDVVSETQIGVMRLKFWRDAVHNIYKDIPPNTPVALELYGATKKFKLSKKWLLNIVEARLEQIYDKAFRDMKHVEDHGDKAFSSINYLLLQCLGVQNLHADHAASHIGKAQSIVTLLRATPYHASKRKVYLPTEILMKYNISQENVIRGNNEQSMRDAVFEIASIAHQHLQHARSLQNNVPKEACLAFLSTVGAEWYLKNLQLVDFNLYDSRLQNRNHLLPFSLWMQKFKKKY